MEQTTLRAEARHSLDEVGQDSGWAVGVFDDRGKMIDDIVVRPKEIGEVGDEAAIRQALSKHYDVSDLELFGYDEVDDDGRSHSLFRISGLRKN